MTRTEKVVLLAAALSVLAVGPGCAMFDGCGCDCLSSTSQYFRGGSEPTPPPPAPAAAPASAPTTVGVSSPADGR